MRLFLGHVYLPEGQEDGETGRKGIEKHSAG